MNVRPPGVEPPVAPTATAGSGPAEARPAAPPENAGAPSARDGVEAKGPAQEAGLVRVVEGKAEAGAPQATLSEVLQQRGASLGDGNLQALPEGVRELMQALGKDGPAALGELFKRLARNAQFKALSPEVQAKAAELLGKLAGGEKSDLQNAERLLRTSAFGSLSEKEQLAVLENLATSGEAREQLGQMLEKPLFNKLDPPSFVDPGQPILLRELAVEPDGRGSHAGAGEDTASKLPENQIKRLIGQVRRLPELSQAAVELTLKVALAPENNLLVARPFAGPFQRVALEGARLTLDLREGLTLPFARFAGDLIPVGTAPTLAPDGGMLFDVAEQNPRQDLRFAFTADAHLLRVITIQR